MILREILRNLALTGSLPMTTDGAIASTPDFIRQNAIGLVKSMGSNIVQDDTLSRRGFAPLPRS